MQTIEDTVEDFRNNILPAVIAEYSETDTIAIDEAWSNWTDALCKDGLIHELQYESWPAFSDYNGDRDIDLVLEHLGLHTSSEFTPASSFDDEWRSKSLNWNVTLTRGDNEVIKTNYSQGVGHLPFYASTAYSDDGKKVWFHDNVRSAIEKGTWTHQYQGVARKLDAPNLDDIFHSLLMDAAALDETFEDWCISFEYDTDSIKALKIYQQCLETGLALQRALTQDIVEYLRDDLYSDY